jgi:hypothetical protein
MRFVPQTRVFYVNKQYRTVFLVDVSSSVLTVDTDGSKIVMGQVTDTYVLSFPYHCLCPLKALSPLK